MIRKASYPRPNWQDRVQELGLVWHTTPEQAGTGPIPHAQPNLPATGYWKEDAFYNFTMAQVEEIESASAACYDMLMQAGQTIIDEKDGLSVFGIPEWAHQPLIDAWNKEPPALNYGRFDFGYDGKSPPKLFEYNCDTPTSLLEASVIQWDWKEDIFPNNDQYNSLHEKLLAKWRDIRGYLPGNLVHFASIMDDIGEDAIHVAYMRDLAQQAGLQTKYLEMKQIGWHDALKNVVDQDDQFIKTIYKLYPWEWIVNEPFGEKVVSSLDKTIWIEPLWKMLFSNKAILPTLSAMFPDSPYLLEASFSELLIPHVKKPKLAREGANISIINSTGQTNAQTGGDYGEEGYVYQALYSLPEYNGKYPVIGAWMVDGQPAGMGIREDGLITGNTANFIPHIIEG